MHGMQAANTLSSSQQAYWCVCMAAATTSHKALKRQSLVLQICFLGLVYEVVLVVCVVALFIIPAPEEGQPASWWEHAGGVWPQAVMPPGIQHRPPNTCTNHHLLLACG